MSARLSMVAVTAVLASCSGSSGVTPGGGSGADGGGDSTAGSDSGADSAAVGDSSADSSMPLEASSDAGPDASADGASSDGTMDAAFEAASDAPADVTFDAGPAPVTVLVLGALGPEQGVPVVSEDASGAVTGTATTDATGTTRFATAAMVTAILGSSSSPVLYTAMGLQPGNTVLVLDWASASGDMAASATLTAIPSTAGLVGVTGYEVTMGGCMGPWTGMVPSSFNLTHHGSHNANPPCVGLLPPAGPGASFPLLLEAEDVHSSRIAFAFAKRNGVSTFDDAGNVDVALGGNWSTTLYTQQVQFGPADGGTLPSFVYYSEIADGLLNPLALSPGGGAPNTVSTHPGFADAVQVEGATSRSNDVVTAVAARSAPPTASGSVLLDVTALGAPLPLTASLSGTTQPTLTWSGAGTSTGVIGLLTWAGLTSDGGSQSGTWWVVAPGAASGAITAPALPAAWLGFAPSSLATVSLQALYAIDGQSAVPSYAALLGIAPAVYPQNYCPQGPYLPPLPQDGTAVMTFYAPGGC